MKEYDEEDFLSLSGIQHFAFCKRQWALIHIEQQWAENLRTVEGELLHERAHDPYFTQKRGAQVVSRGMPVFSRTLGTRGVCDVVELHGSKSGVSLFGREGLYLPVPVEYKRGSPKQDDSDVLQLTAQAICLEEMFLCDIPEGYLYYGEIKRRTKVLFDERLRRSVRDLFVEMHDLYDRRNTPKVKTGKHCRACSLSGICLPKLCRAKSAKAYIHDRIGENEPCENF